MFNCLLLVFVSGTSLSHVWKTLNEMTSFLFPSFQLSCTCLREWGLECNQSEHHYTDSWLSPLPCGLNAKKWSLRLILVILQPENIKTKSTWGPEKNGAKGNYKINLLWYKEILNLCILRFQKAHEDMYYEKLCMQKFLDQSKHLLIVYSTDVLKSLCVCNIYLISPFLFII